MLKKSHAYCLAFFLYQYSGWAQVAETFTPDLREFSFEEIIIPEDDGLQAWDDIDQFYQNEAGVIWMLIKNGVYRYNGHNAVNITEYLAKTYGLSINRQSGTRFLFDSQGALWYGTRKGLFKIDLRQPKADRIELDTALHAANWRNYILELEESRDTIYVGTANGLYLVDRDSGTMLDKYLNTGRDVRHRESSKAVQAILPDLEPGALWVALMDGLYRIDKSSTTYDRFTVTNIWPDSLAHNFNPGTVRKDTLFLPSYGLGMVSFDIETMQFERYPTQSTDPNDYRYNIIRSALPYNDSILFINATRLGNGLFNMNHKSYQWLSTPEPMKDGVFLNRDRAGYVWGAKRGRIFRSKEAIFNNIGITPVVDISGFYANGVLVGRPAIGDSALPQWQTSERNIRVDFSITPPYSFEPINYVYRIDKEKWQPVTQPNSLEIFDLNIGNHRIGIQALDESGKVLATTEFSFQITIPFYESSWFRIVLLLGILIFIIIVFNNYNQRKLAVKLQEIDTLKSDFFASISHEFRTPLTLIQGPIQDQLLNPVLAASEKENLNMALRNVSHLEDLVNQLLDLSKLESGHFKLRVALQNLSEFLGGIVESFVFKASENGQTLTADIRLEKDCYWFDEEAIRAIVVNLLDNAIKYSPKGASISLHAKSLKNDQLELSVQNTGVQLSQKEQSQIFNRFHRSDHQERGTGIGLALVKELVERHGGSIRVISRADALEFLVYLLVNEKDFPPAERQAQQKRNRKIANLDSTTVQLEASVNQQQLSKITAPQNGKPLLLIIEDHNELRLYLKSSFKKDYEILLANNGTSGLELAQKEIPDLVITDLMMPGMDGIALTRALKTDTLTSHIPVILLTAIAGDENRIAGLDTGADSYITKPFNAQVLKKTAENLLANRQRLQERLRKCTQLSPVDIALNSQDERFLEQLQTAMDQYLVEPDFRAERFAQVLGMSRMQLHRKLKAITGFSTSEFIRFQRLKLATRMLEKNNCNISQVAYAVGFNNPSHFAKCFKNEFGTSPSNYAKKG